LLEAKQIAPAPSMTIPYPLTQAALKLIKP
jgi:hypothetical protein